VYTQGYDLNTLSLSLVDYFDYSFDLFVDLHARACTSMMVRDTSVKNNCPHNTNLPKR
jgi:hypothetical protein